jgi:chlorobactene glucosyltransferase
MTNAKHHEPHGVLLSVIIPARNEERSISRCVESLQKQELKEIEIIVVDDESDDRTAAIVRQLQQEDDRITLVQLVELPQGWTGKNYAAYQGYLKSTGQWLLYTDADTYHYPNSLRRSLELAEENRMDCLSYSPEQECCTFWELVLQPAIFQLLDEWFSYERVSDNRQNDAAANGQYILIRRKVMQEVGGHAAVKDKILEDVEIAKIVKRLGYRLHFCRGTGMVKTRMYQSFNEWWKGWAKSIYPLRQNKTRDFISATARRLAMDVMPSVLLACSAFALLQGTGSSWVVAILAGTVIIRWSWIMYLWKGAGFDPLYSGLYPLSSLIVVSVMWYSVYSYRKNGSVEWKSRLYTPNKVTSTRP